MLTTISKKLVIREIDLAIYWRDFYNINFPDINEERKFFFTMLNKLDSGDFAEQRQLSSLFIRGLLDNIQSVFNKEENIFRKQGCPGNLIDRQEIEHLEFIKELQQISSAGDFKSAIQFISLLKTFVINHIIGTDLECKVYLKDTYVQRFHGNTRTDGIFYNLFNKKSLVKWSEYYETGISIVDEQHMVFASILNDLVANYTIYTLDTMLDIIDELIDYENIHFATEEELMRSLGDAYPQIDEHIKQHRDFSKYISGISKKIKNSDRLVDIMESEEFVKQLITWLIEHLTGIDKDFAKIYKAKQHI